MENIKTGAELIATERQLKQIEKHGFTAEHLANNPQWYGNGQLISAAHVLSSYDKYGGLERLCRDIVPLNWDKDWWQRLCDKPLMDRLVISGAFIAAEIDRIMFINQLKTYK